MSRDHNAPDETPWGLKVHETKYSEHVFGVETAEHGGIYLTPEQQRKLPDELKVHSFRGEGAWWDGAEAWTIPVLYIAYKQSKQLEADVDVEYAEKKVREKYPHLLPLISSAEISHKGNQQSLPPKGEEEKLARAQRLNEEIKSRQQGHDKDKDHGRER